MLGRWLLRLFLTLRVRKYELGGCQGDESDACKCTTWWYRGAPGLELGVERLPVRLVMGHGHGQDPRHWYLCVQRNPVQECMHVSAWVEMNTPSPTTRAHESFHFAGRTRHQHACHQHAGERQEGFEACRELRQS